MMSTVYLIHGGTGGDVVRDFTSMPRMRFSDQIAADADVATEGPGEEQIAEKRMEHVLRLKAAIEEGRYMVSPEVLADRMMASMLRMGRAEGGLLSANVASRHPNPNDRIIRFTSVT